MKYIVIRNRKSDKLTLHSAACSVPKKVLGEALVELAAVDTKDEAIESVAFHGGKVKICDCAKEMK